MQPAKYKRFYDQKVQKSKLEVEVGDKVLIWAHGLRGKTKIADEETPYVM